MGAASSDTGTPAAAPATIDCPVVSGAPAMWGSSMWSMKPLAESGISLHADLLAYATNTAHPHVGAPSGERTRSAAPRLENRTALKAATVASGASMPLYRPSGPCVAMALRTAPMALRLGSTCIITCSQGEGSGVGWNADQEGW